MMTSSLDPFYRNLLNERILVTLQFILNYKEKDMARIQVFLEPISMIWLYLRRSSILTSFLSTTSLLQAYISPLPCLLRFSPFFLFFSPSLHFSSPLTLLRSVYSFLPPLPTFPEPRKLASLTYAPRSGHSYLLLQRCKLPICLRLNK